uniref:Uncharacterized protein n=1 Tax=Nelumbo nucifera TaxID=4432 RepID=A0A822YVY1_NELNU|nr:TPA_asm: hypothetical protein HUJ06_005546 [Nelumbo nucifera]
MALAVDSGSTPVLYFYNCLLNETSIWLSWTMVMVWTLDALATSNFLHFEGTWYINFHMLLQLEQHPTHLN